ncbi:hypothetical protein AB0N87_28685 [Streptomyces sp. NPDC093228]|uniref:hypothetical protein n=1 Tax=Streptomyces sp. NPDC093228 TaxID=3155070 RepID=UPI00343410E1
MDEVKSWFISPAADEDVPLTADASVADAWGPCECGSGMVFLKAPTLSDVRQEFGKLLCTKPKGTVAVGGAR